MWKIMHVVDMAVGHQTNVDTYVNVLFSSVDVITFCFVSEMSDFVLV